MDWWRGLDSNQRRRTPADLQSAPFSHSGTPPQGCAPKRKRARGVTPRAPLCQSTHPLSLAGEGRVENPSPREPNPPYPTHPNPPITRRCAPNPLPGRRDPASTALAGRLASLRAIARPALGPAAPLNPARLRARQPVLPRRPSRPAPKLPAQNLPASNPSVRPFASPAPTPSAPPRHPPAPRPPLPALAAPPPRAARSGYTASTPWLPRWPTPAAASSASS